VTLSELIAAALALIRRPRRPAADFPPRCPAMTFGDPASPTTHTLYLHFEADLTPAGMGDVARGLWPFLGQLGNVALVTRRPDRFPACYGTLVYGPPLGFTRVTFPPNGAAAVTPARWLVPGNEPWWHECVWVDHARTAPTTAARVAALTHEIAHGYGWPYTHAPAEGSPEWWALIRKGPPRAAQLAAAVLDRFQAANGRAV
jgi:hypothetical protein